MKRETLTEAQGALLSRISEYAGVIWLRGDEAATAISMAATPYIALGPDEPNGVVAAMITPAGRQALADREGPEHG